MIIMFFGDIFEASKVLGYESFVNQTHMNGYVGVFSVVSEELKLAPN